MTAQSQSSATSSGNPLAGTPASAPVKPKSGLTARLQPFLIISERFGNMMSRLLLGAMYFLLLGPFALLYRLAADPLHLRRRRKGNWTAWTTHNDTLANARRQD